MQQRLKTWLLAGAAVSAALAFNGAVFAQEEEDTGASAERITVTGTRIQSSGFNTPTPVTAVNIEELEMANPGNLVAAIVQLPQFYNSTTTTDTGGFFTSPGTGNLNLRGLEPSRTLTLLNGRRMVSSTRFGGTDINTFPEEMIKTVEAVTGGASAQYGSDAVSGVVNFILDTDFEGARAHAQMGISDRGDNENWEVGFAYGTGFNEDRGHLLLSAEMYDQDPVFTYEDRDWYQSWGLVREPGQTVRRVRPNVTSAVATLNGVISSTNASLNLREFLPDGTTTQPFVLGEFANVGPGNNALGTPTPTYQSHVQTPGASGTDNTVHPNVQPDTGRESYFAYLDYDLTDNLTVFGQAIWGYNETAISDLGGFYGAPFMPLTIFSGNPFLPASIQSTMTSGSVASITVQKVGSELDTSNRYDITENTMTSFTGGFTYDFLEGGVGNGDWLNGWTADAYGQSGNTSYNSIVQGGLRIDRLPLALDAVRDPSGNIVCRVNTAPFLAANGGRWSDCVPINLFGQGNASPEALDWVLGYDEGQQIDTVLAFTDSGTALGHRDSYISGPDKVASGEIDATVFDLAFSGDVWKGWGAGPISAAFGYSYREESIYQVVRDPANPTNVDNVPATTAFPQAGRPVPYNDAGCAPNIPARPVAWGVRGSPCGNATNSVAIQFSKVPNIMGDLSTIEYFSEILVPVIADQPWMQQLNVSGAARRADYSGSGEIWAWKYGVDAQIIDDFRFRATQSRDIRAATLAERYDRTGGFANIQCVNPANPTGPRISCPIFTVSGGNPEVQPETADTTTLGFVYQPSWRFLDGFSLSVDWYDIDLSDAIAPLTAQQIYDECQNGDLALCDRIQTGAGGVPTLINMSVLNINKAKVSGIDVEAAYRRSFDLFGGGESIGARLYVGYLDENSRANFGAATVHLEEGILYPQFKVNMSLNYNRGPLSLFIQERYQSETLLNTAWQEGFNPVATVQTVDDNDIDEVWITDFNAAYTFENFRGGEWEVFGNVANVFDADPPVIANFANFGQNATQTGGNFDRLGRRYVVGLRLRY